MRRLGRIATTSGKGSNAERARQLADLFAQATEREQEFLARLLIGELRQGALEGLMIEAVASAGALPADAVRRAAMIAGGIASVAAIALTEGAAALGRFAIALFQPLAPMLAQPADDIEDAMSRIPLAALEWKLDGARVQVHKQGEEIRIYSRTGNDVTAAAPEIAEAIAQVRAQTLILDGEAIALKPAVRPTHFRTRCVDSAACSTSRQCASTMLLSVVLLRLPAPRRSGSGRGTRDRAFRRHERDATAR